MTKRKKKPTPVINWELLHEHCENWIVYNNSNVVSLAKTARIEETKFHRFYSNGQELPVGDFFKLCAAMAVNPLVYVTIELYIQVPLKGF